MREPIVITAEPLFGYDWPSRDRDWLTIVVPDGIYQLRPDNWMVRNLTTQAVVRLGLEPVADSFRPTREWGARAVRAARALLPGF
jgi:hypothetical protein